MGSKTIVAAVLSAGLGLAGVGTAQEQAAPPVQIQKLPSPGTLELMRAPAPKLAPDAETLRAKLAKAQADLTALAGEPPPPGAGQRKLAALREQQAEEQQLAGQLEALMVRLDGGAAAGDVGQELQLRLQQVMDRQQKAAQTQSNILKRHHETTSSIISNLK